MEGAGSDRGGGGDSERASGAGSLSLGDILLLRWKVHVASNVDCAALESITQAKECIIGASQAPTSQRKETRVRP